MSNNSSTSLYTASERAEIQQYLDNVNYVIAFIQGFICIVGILGNVLALIVINRKSLRNTSSSVFITYMALFDTAVLLMHAINLIRIRGQPVLHCTVSYLTDLSTFCANWVLVIITLERCVAVYSPFLAKRFCTVDSARYSIYTLFIFAIVLFTTIFPFTHHTGDSKNNSKCLLRSKRGLIVRIYQPILFYAIPDLLLLSNLFTVGALCRRQHRMSVACTDDGLKSNMRISDINSNRKQRQLTIMLVTVSLSFYLFTTPAMIAFIGQQKPPVRRELRSLKQDFVFKQLSVVFLQMNNATNFIFYCFAGQRFRQVTRHTFHEYSALVKTFYHRYILCNKQYVPVPIHHYQSHYLANTTMTSRGSCSPYVAQRSQQYPRRTSTL